MKRSFAGIDLGGTQIKGVVVDEAGGILRTELRPTNDDGTDAIAFAKSIQTLAHNLGSDLPLGISAPGLARGGWSRDRLASWPVARSRESRLDRVSSGAM
jgi:predicted NBD/HSP70 family sugar kinase